MNKRDYYEVLGLTKGASKEEIKKAKFEVKNLKKSILLYVVTAIISTIVLSMLAIVSLGSIT